MNKVLITGAFDLLHRGHIELLRRGSSLGDILYIGLSTDATIRRRKGQDRPINSYEDRAELLRAITVVHSIYPIRGLTHEQIMQCTYELVEKLKPDIIVSGYDRTAEEFVKPLVDRFNWLTYVAMYHGYEDNRTGNIIEKVRGE